MNTRAFAVPLLVVAATVASPVDADVTTVAPVVVTVTGPESVRVIVAEGNVAPCDASDNRPLYQGFVAPGQPLVLQTTGACVCVQQTFAPMTHADWGPAGFACRPVVCRTGYRGAPICTPAPDPTIRVTLSSRR